MPLLIQQSTTQCALPFLMVLTSDHITAATGLTPTVTIRKEGGSFATPGGTVTEIASGWYQVAANATDTNTLGSILLHATAGTADPADLIVAEVVAFNPQDSGLGMALAAALKQTTNAIGQATCTTGGSTTSIPTSALLLAGSAASGVVLNQFAGRVVLFDGNTTTAGLQGSVSVITASSASNTPTLTVAPVLPATPVSGDTFSIV